MKSMAKIIPIAPHTVEPYDGHEGMVKCSNCTRASVPDFRFSGGCARYVPSMRDVLQRCPHYRFKGRAS